MTTRILPLLPGVKPRTSPRSLCSLKIGAALYEHSAAQFWAHLLDELGHDFPDGSALELTVVSEELLHPSRLHPVHEFEIEAEKQLHGQNPCSLSAAIAALDLLGSPGVVHARICRGIQELYAGALPPECADAETFFYLAAWLLQWAGIEPRDWTAPDVSGCIQARAPGRGIAYEAVFGICREPVKEGLFRYRLTLSVCNTKVC